VKECCRSHEIEDGLLESAKIPEFCRQDPNHPFGVDAGAATPPAVCDEPGFFQSAR
jgi:hypothetical protein